jgi:hypothetical protein
MRQFRQRPQPLRHRTGLVGGKRAKLGADTGALENRRPLLAPGHGAVTAEQRRHVHRKSGIAHPSAEAGDMGADSGHFGHDDDSGTVAGAVDPLGDVVQRDLANREILKRVVLLHGSIGHTKCFLCDEQGERAGTGAIHAGGRLVRVSDLRQGAAGAGSRTRRQNPAVSTDCRLRPTCRPRFR